jgi:hypothetical protein
VPSVKKSVLAITGPIAAALLAMGAVTVAVWVGARSNGPAKAFTSTPQFLFWLLVLATQAAVVVVALPYVCVTVWRRGRSLRSTGVLDARSVAGLGVVALLLVWIAAAFTAASGIKVGGLPIAPTLSDLLRDFPNGKAFPLPDFRLRVGPFYGVAIFGGVLAVVGIWLAAVALLEMSRDTASGGLAWFVELRDEINTLLAIAGLMIGLGTLAIGLLREAVLATNQITLKQSYCRHETTKQGKVKTDWCTHPADDPKTKVKEQGYRTFFKFDRLYVALYGLFFTVLFAVAFAPCYLALRTTGNSLRDRALPLPVPTESSFDEINRKREAFDASLQTNLSALPTVKAGVSILSPFILSLIPLLFGVPK